MQRKLIERLREVIMASVGLKVVAEQLGTTRVSFLRIVLYISLINLSTQTAICTFDMTEWNQILGKIEK